LGFLSLISAPER
jgi:hypothetical protein